MSKEQITKNISFNRRGWLLIAQIGRVLGMDEADTLDYLLKRGIDDAVRSKLITINAKEKPPEIEN